MQDRDSEIPADRTSRRQSRKYWPGLAISLLGLAVLIQLTMLGRDTFREFPRLISDLGQPAAWRSARYSQGRRFAQYIRFLNQVIPPEGRVVLPPDSAAPRAIATTPLMQFFLLPRRVINCTGPDCLETLSLQDTAVLVTGGFPGPEILSQGRLEQFDADWGVLLPLEQAPNNPPPPQGYSHATEIARDFLLATAWLASLTLGGFMFVRQLLSPTWGTARLALGYGLGLALLTLLLALASLVGIPLGRETVLAITLLLPGAAGASHLVRRKQAIPSDQGTVEQTPASKPTRLDPWPVLFVLLAGLAALFSFGQGFHATDELVLWGVKGYGIATDGAIRSVTQWGTNTVAYPLHIPLAIAASRLLLGEALPAAKLVFPAYALALSLLLYQTLRQLGLRRAIAGLATLAAITTPLVFRHGTLAYANLALSFYLFAALALLALAVALRDPPPAPGILLLSGAMFASAAWTRPEGLAFSWLMMGVALLAAYFIRKVWIGWRRLALLISPLLAYSAFWLWLNSEVYSLPLGRAGLAGEAAEQFLSGNLHLQEALYIIRYLPAGLLEAGSWGLLGILTLLVLLVLLFIVGLRRLHRTKGLDEFPGKATASAALIMALCGWVYLLAIAGLYYLASYDTAHDISWWVSTGLDRMLMPGLLLAWAGGVGWLQVLIPGLTEPPVPK
ncbi:MAG: hypothetical protein A2W35_16820 [Chloroflexi bacterium RBG_16_57_11]|nr:MAG: hypothetical protein A2W35_16820 [Chloroflexi bacterium RBG_16_57_11]